MLQYNKLYLLRFSLSERSALFRKAVLLFILFCSCIYQAFGTHLRAGQITVKYVGPRTVDITVEVWTNTLNTTVLFGGDQDILDFGDGNTIFVPETRSQRTGPSGIPLPPNVEYASFTVYGYQYTAPGTYKISYREPNRNEGVLNMDGSVNTTFYLETVILIGAGAQQNNSPVLLIDPIDRACPGVAFFHNPGAYDPDERTVGDSLSYEMVVPFSSRNTPVVNYRDPNHPSFYTNYETASENGTRPTFSINAVTGDLRWDAPGKVGEYNIAFHVVEHRKINGVWRRIGYVRRDMQILVEDCDNERPTLELPADTCVVAGTLLNVDVIGKDPDGDPVKIEAFSQILNPPFNPVATITPDPGPEDFVSVPATTNFEWQTDCSHIREQPYSVVFKITDKPVLGPRLATFDTWFITVVGPKPVWNTAVPNNTERSVTLTWNPYECAQAVSMQVWRKVEGSDFEPTNCDIGMPPYLGYELISTVPLNNGTVTSFTDNNRGAGLEIGPRYCYRLVAVFPAGTRAESLVSDDICIEPFDLVTPVITHVDIDVTDNTNGTIIVRWVEPKENPDFPLPHNFRYEIWRGTGFSGDSVFVASTTDLSFTDTGLNTESNIYHYTINAYSEGNAFVGSSGQASSVRIEAQSRNQRIDLTWSADVPWSNNASGLKHILYRGDDPSADTKDDLVMLGEINVNAGGFTYIDQGPLENRKYCYMVETYGSYGNTDIHTDPLINRSQIICAEPGDDIPPCQPPSPSLLQPPSCEERAKTLDDCSGSKTYTNVIEWERDASDCANDVAFYVIWATSTENGEYLRIDTVRVGTRYEHTGLRNSYARCYKITAVDRSGNESEKSEAFCIDNCPYYELPNVFTPNGDGCNDVFRAYNDKYSNTGETSSGECVIPFENQLKCARFVRRVEFKVYNRWGREVYTYTGQTGGNFDFPEDRILINWDGKSSDGQQLSTGIYYYIAEVEFITINPANRFKTIKGWVHLIRDTPSN